MQITDDSAI
ncbi:hypothetical protein AVEN_38636-1, partial [Araneus ventricosus]